MFERYEISFKTVVANIAPASHQTISENGPYIDAHLGSIDHMAPIGQTFYLRPLVSYAHTTRELTIFLEPEQPTIHMNSNSVTPVITYEGEITISGFEYGRYRPSATIDVNMTVNNFTDLPLRGLHIHDGLQQETGACTGFTNFGPISLFLYTTRYWNEKKTAYPFPLPANDVVPQTSYLQTIQKVF